MASLKETKLKQLVLLDRFAHNVDVHLSCDASKKAYAACIYFVASTTDRNTQSALLVTKAKVAPNEISLDPLSRGLRGLSQSCS